jgi:hypothetical protein
MTEIFKAEQVLIKKHKCKTYGIEINKIEENRYLGSGPWNLGKL